MSATSAKTLLTSHLEIVAQADDWLDGRVADLYKSQPLAKHWARVSKVVEEAGECIEALVSWSGQNPRKPQRTEAYGELLEELSDVVITAILAIQHFTKDADETFALLNKRMDFLYRRMCAADPEWFGPPLPPSGEVVSPTRERSA